MLPTVKDASNCAKSIYLEKDASNRQIEMLPTIKDASDGVRKKNSQRRGADSAAPPPPPPLFYSLTTYANEIKFGTVIVHYIINNLVKKIGLSRVNFCWRQQNNLYIRYFL